MSQQYIQFSTVLPALYIHKIRFLLKIKNKLLILLLLEIIQHDIILKFSNCYVLAANMVSCQTSPHYQNYYYGYILWIETIRYNNHIFFKGIW